MQLLEAAKALQRAQVATVSYVARKFHAEYVKNIEQLISRYEQHLILTYDDSVKRVGWSDQYERHIVNELIKLGHDYIAVAAALGYERALRDLVATGFLKWFSHPVRPPFEAIKPSAEFNDKYLTDSFGPAIKDSSQAQIHARLLLYSNYLWRAAEYAYRYCLKQYKTEIGKPKKIRESGTSSSGDYAHAGRPGERGGSASSFPGERSSKNANSYWLGNANVEIATRAEDDYKNGSPAGVLIQTIKVPTEFRGQGEANQAMQTITKWADGTHTILFAEPAPFDDRPMSLRQLRSWYRQLGFKDYAPGTMIRRPLSESLHEAEADDEDFTSVFAGPDDAETCAGCDDAVADNPYPLDDAPEPGSFECMSNCRHFVQLSEDAPDDLAPYEWHGLLGFGSIPSGYYDEVVRDQDLLPYWLLDGSKLHLPYQPSHDGIAALHFVGTIYGHAHRQQAVTQLGESGTSSSGDYEHPGRPGERGGSQPSLERGVRNVIDPLLVKWVYSSMSPESIQLRRIVNNASGNDWNRDLSPKMLETWNDGTLARIDLTPFLTFQENFKQYADYASRKYDEQFPEHPMLYRGVGGEEASAVFDAKPGDTIHFGTLTSTSLDQNVAQAFSIQHPMVYSDVSQPKVPVVIELEGVTGKDVFASEASSPLIFDKSSSHQQEVVLYGNQHDWTVTANYKTFGIDLRNGKEVRMRYVTVKPI